MSRRDSSTPVDRGAYDATKPVLVERFGITEEAAHRLIMRIAMDLRVSTRYAADIIRLGLMAYDALREMVEDASGPE